MSFFLGVLIVVVDFHLMVELMRVRSQMSSFGTADNLPVKLGIKEEDSLDEEFGPLNKRSRLSPATSSSLQVLLFIFYGSFFVIFFC